jgi:phospholipase/carboxylesterase
MAYGTGLVFRAMLPSLMGELDVVWAGGTDHRGGGDGPLVVLLHGFGAPGTDLVSLHRVLDAPAGTRFAFPAGVVDLGPMFGGDARAWWFIDLEERLRRQARGESRDPNEVPDGMDHAASLVALWIDSVRGASPLVVGGFSQGAMLALEVALRLHAPPNGLVLMSSTLLAAARQKPLLPKLANTPIFQSHGRQDAILAFEDAEKLHAHLQTAEFLPFRGGHEIPEPVIRGVSALIRKAAVTTSS